jgi:hypothetical protein
MLSFANMKRIVTLFLCTLLSFTLGAQDITGIWRGYFMSGMGFYKQQYKYEVQIKQSSNLALKAVTYSYKTTVFYGKASAQGINMSKTRNVVLREDKLLDVKVSDKSEPCLMTCYLEYSKDGKIEILQGTFTSTNLRDKSDCGAGTVYLEKVTESDFKKEEFLVTKPKTTITKPPGAKPKVVPNTKAKTTTATNSKRPPVKKESAPWVKVGPAPSPDNIYIPEKPKEKKELTVPRAIRERSNAVVKTIITNSKEITIELYDNGEIDNDTITVYHNNDLIAYKKRLSDKPVTIKIMANENDALHEFVIVADNLGTIPPNTALMVVSTGGKRYELFIASSEQKNAKIVFQYKAQ